MRVVLLAALGAAVLLFAGWLWRRWHRAKERWTSAWVGGPVAIVRTPAQAVKALRMRREEAA